MVFDRLLKKKVFSKVFLKQISKDSKTFLNLFIYIFKELSSNVFRNKIELFSNNFDLFQKFF